MDTPLSEKRFMGLNAVTIKYIAIAAMLIDHIAWAFVPFNSTPGIIMHVIGRITAPTMCYFIAEGYYHTKNLKKFFLRLSIFAIISHFTFVFMETGKFIDTENFYTGVIYTLALGLLALFVCDKVKYIWLKIPIVLLICFVASFGDWGYVAVAWILAFGLNRDKPVKQILWFSAISITFITVSTVMLLMQYPQAPIDTYFWQFGVFLAIPLILLYNKKLGSNNKFNKWVFYVFYPLHSLIIGFINYYIIIN